MTFLNDYQEMTKLEEKYDALNDKIHDQIHDFLVYYCNEHPRLRIVDLWDFHYDFYPDTVRIDWYKGRLVVPIECFDSTEKRDLFVARIVDRIKERQMEKE